MSAGALVGGLLLTSPAFAAVDDSFGVASATWICPYAGNVHFFDYGDGVPGGAMNDDYIYIYDQCPDGEGVRARAWVNGVYQGKKFNADGFDSSVFWDPFPNVYPGDKVKLEVCLVDDGEVHSCKSNTHISVDG